MKDARTEIATSHGYRREIPFDRIIRRVAERIPDGWLRRTARDVYRKAMGAALQGRGFQVCLPDGQVLRLLPEFRYLTWNPIELDAFKAATSSGAVALDIGANAGAYSLALGNWVGVSGRVYAFEPADEAYDGLVRHIRLNDLTEIVLPVRVAVAGHTGTALFEMDSISGQNSTTDNASGRPVNTVTVDHFCSIHNILPSFIKIDVEGSELEVLRGARNTIKQCGSALSIFVEMHPTRWATMGISADDLRTELDYQGLTAEALRPVQDPWALEGECVRLVPLIERR